MHISKMTSFKDFQFDLLLMQQKDIVIVQPKFEELMRLSRSKMQILPKNHERNRNLAIFEISCELLKIPFKKDEFKRRMGFPKDYNEARRLLSGILGTSNTNEFNVKAFLLKYNFSDSFELTVNKLLMTFESLYLATMDDGRRSTYNLKSKLYFVAGAFVVAYLQNYPKLNRKEFASSADVEVGQFNRICDEILRVIPVSMFSEYDKEEDDSSKSYNIAKKQRVDMSERRIVVADSFDDHDTQANDDMHINTLNRILHRSSTSTSSSSPSMLKRSLSEGQDQSNHQWKQSSLRQQRVRDIMPGLNSKPTHHQQQQLTEDQLEEIEKAKREQQKKAWEQDMYAAWKSELLASSDALIESFIRKPRKLYDFSW